MKRPPFFGILLCLFVLLGACAPIGASSAISRAQDDLAKAEAAGASKAGPGGRCDTRAQLNYHQAQGLLAKAKELNGYANYEEAVVAADKAAALSRDAVRVMRDRTKKTSTRCFEPTAPASTPAAPVQSTRQ
jgi:hypothetical protein